MFKRFRLKKHLSRPQLGDIAGVSPEAIEAYENGYRFPAMDTLRTIAETLDVSLHYLLTKCARISSEQFEEALDFDRRRIVKGKKIYIPKERKDSIRREPCGVCGSIDTRFFLFRHPIPNDPLETPAIYQDHGHPLTPITPSRVKGRLNICRCCIQESLSHTLGQPVVIFAEGPSAHLNHNRQAAKAQCQTFDKNHAPFRQLNELQQKFQAEYTERTILIKHDLDAFKDKPESSDVLLARLQEISLTKPIGICRQRAVCDAPCKDPNHSTCQLK
jgi:transcriptional regulator with XRE-family HTH domain